MSVIVMRLKKSMNIVKNVDVFLRHMRVKPCVNGVKKMKYLKRVAIAASVLVNVILGGEQNQTFSARNRAWQKRNRLNLVWLIDLICGKDHCSQCYAYWLIRKNKW